METSPLTNYVSNNISAAEKNVPNEKDWSMDNTKIGIKKQNLHYQISREKFEPEPGLELGPPNV